MSFATLFGMSTFVPITLGFFGLGTGYLVYGPHELFGFPPRDSAVDRSLGVWGIFMPGLCHLVTGMILFIGLTWVHLFVVRSLFLAAVAFSAYESSRFSLCENLFHSLL